jgi:hypothetical protein
MSDEVKAPKKRKRKIQRLTKDEKTFAEYQIYENLGCIEAARLAFGWPCEPNSASNQKAVNLNRSQRIVKYKFQIAKKFNQEVAAQKVLSETADFEFDDIRQFIYRRLETIRDDSNAPGGSRFKAIAALEKMTDPAADVNLILMWVDLLWRAGEAHCPCCHASFPLKDIENSKLNTFRDDVALPPDEEVESLYDRRMTILERADNRKKPHPGQIVALNAPERNIAGLGPARSGKSLLLAMFAILAFMIPGVEIWILARVYADAGSEIEYITKFLNTLFYPYTKHIITRREDKKTEELTLESKWGSVLKVKSAKAKGSITGRELELALIAEPGWVPDDIFNHLRARMTSRLGRTILLGTPQGFGGILGRFTQMTRRDDRGRMKRISTDERTIEAGCPWNVSLLKYSMKPHDNPEYVASELEAAKQELTEAEYASEFEGLMATAEGAMFPQLAERHLQEIPREVYENCVWVLGIDQGPKNFAACLVGFDGRRVIAANEYFNDGPYTMKSKMQELRDMVPGWIRQAGGTPDRWRLTIFDVDPPLLNELDEFEDAGEEWPTDVTFRIKDKKGRWNQENWRRETYEFLNNLAQPRETNILFDTINCDFLHDQMVRAQARPGDDEMRQKGWIIKDPIRGDHVPDAFIMALFTILSGQMVLPDAGFKQDDPYADSRKAFEFRLRVDENKELSGFTGNKTTPDEQFEKTFGRKRLQKESSKNHWNYKDY